MSNAYRSTLAGGGSAPVGDATAADVLSGKTFSGAVGSGVTGTMPNNGAVTQTVGAGQTYTIPAGYHNGSGTVTGTGSAFPTISADGLVSIPQADFAQYEKISVTVTTNYAILYTGATALATTTELEGRGKLNQTWEYTFTSTDKQAAYITMYIGTGDYTFTLL